MHFQARNAVAEEVDRWNQANKNPPVWLEGLGGVQSFRGRDPGFESKRTLGRFTIRKALYQNLDPDANVLIMH